MWRNVYLRSRLYISGTGSLEWSLHSNGEHLEIREPEDGDKIWFKMEDGVGIHLNPDGTQVLSILTGQITPYKSIVPSSDNTCDLGSSSYRWKDGYFAGNVTIGGYGNLGSLRIGGTEVITSGRVLKNIASVAQSLLPDADNTRDLGSSSYFWRDLYLGGSLRGLGNVQILIQSRQTYGTAIRIQGGSSTIIAGGEGGDQVWNNIANLDDEWLYLASDQSVKIITALQGGWSARIENATFSADGNNYLRNTLPSSDNTYDLGSSSYGWRDLHIKRDVYLYGLPEVTPTE